MLRLFVALYRQRIRTKKAVLTNLTPHVSVVGRETIFNVREVQKGDKTLKQILLRRYRLLDPSAPMRNGPSLLEFGGRIDELFLLYLVKEPDGRFAPITGQTDPAFSVVNVPASNTAPQKFIGRWWAQNGLMGETDSSELALDHTVRWEHTDSTFQPPAVTILTGRWKQPDEFSYVVLQLTNRVDRQGARLLEIKHENRKATLCLKKGKPQLF